MSTQTVSQQVRWQDLKTRSELDIVLEIAKKEGWKDCEVFGHGAMITQPRESMGWKLIPADLYKYSIPMEGIRRLHQIINAGVRVQGVVIADDGRRTETPPAPARPKVLLPAVRPILSFIGKALLGLIGFLGVIALVSLFILYLFHYAPVVLFGSILVMGLSTVHDPKLVILVDDGNGDTVWVSVSTWYD